MVSINKLVLSLLAAVMLLVSTPSSAASLQLFNGSAWVDSGTVVYTGPVSLTYLGITVPCTMSMAVSIHSSKTFSASTVTSLSESGSTTCSGIFAGNLPWAIALGYYSGPNPPFTGAPTLTPPLYSFTITGVRLFIPAPLNVNCPSATGSGTVNAVIDGSGRMVFKSALGPCVFQTQNNGFLTPSVPVRVVP